MKQFKIIIPVLISGVLGLDCLAADEELNVIAEQEVSNRESESKPVNQIPESNRYLISVGDTLRIFVWRNPELSETVPVRPDGRISLPLIDDIEALKKTPEQLATEIEVQLSKFIKQPEVTVIVTSFGLSYGRSIKVVGAGIKPLSIPFSENITLLDIVIQIGGVPPNANGSKAVIVRKEGISSRKIKVDLDDLLNKADLSQNILMQQGDILLIPEKWF